MEQVPMLYSSKEDCCGCMACANVCPVNAISFAEDTYGFHYPQIDPEKCIQCSKCIRTCDFQKHGNGVPKTHPLRCYAAVNKDKRTLKKSTSGGVFSALADIVFEDGGVVFGCVFDRALNPRHVMAENVEQLEPMHGSKYVQSNVGDTYRRVKDCLSAGRKVLFSGTPCQVAGLYACLGSKDIDRLFTVEIICHGTPSAGMFHRYIALVEKAKGARIEDFHFRSKKRGWGVGDYTFDQEYQDASGKNRTIPAAAAAYMVNFRKNNLHRSSCFHCPYASPERVADFTMGDFWGYDSVGVKSEYYNGLSILLMNHEKAVSLYPRLEQRLTLEEVSDIEAALRTNGNLYRPSPKGDMWEYWMASYANGTFEKDLEAFGKECSRAARWTLVKRAIPFPVYLFLKKAKQRLRS